MLNYLMIATIKFNDMPCIIGNCADAYPCRLNDIEVKTIHYVMFPFEISLFSSYACAADWTISFVIFCAESTAVPSNQGKLRLNAEIPTDSELMELLHIELAGEERIAAHEFFMTLAACNTVIPILTHSSSSDEVHDTVGTIEYQGESPDEQALVAAASAYGYTLCERTSGHIVIDVNGEKLR